MTPGRRDEPRPGAPGSSADIAPGAARDSPAAPPAAPAWSRDLAPGRRRAARFVALTADLLQLAVFPLFGEGFASPLDDALDLAVAAILIKLVGFHWSFVPAFGLELVPGVDLAPTWSASVMLATSRGASRSSRWTWIAIGSLAVLAAVLIWRTYGHK